MLDSINNSISLLKRLKEVSDNIADAEFKNILADLSLELAEAKLAIADLKEDLAATKEDNRILKQKSLPAETKPSGTKWGCYQFADESGLFCTACWDSKRQKSITQRMNTKTRMCNVCKSTIYM
ncbi:hypothetical protein [Vibrio parahaemolyticus]|uniref:hypothetical protein n=1 Tax=Vibrio parahaemolyticus TaxID=670 RepID=UPI001123F0A3|nr:hypothetical protein [Vibrio parahaemolyticus]MCQ9100214.1 hypothetical protein [Vibrio parahaemolyticus]MDL2009755.1 hypothetical protein [Vibrio parahaemolyticus]TON79324.1 hypothetical protein CGH49_22730 [Vibrio parahaemolyticus]HCG6695574.1 hypothetical protein [Vibrio parahaemolyticus]